jgi:hypothetical protein
MNRPNSAFVIDDAEERAASTPMDTSVLDEVLTSRPEANRRPLNGMTERLRIDVKISGMHMHIFNDTGPRLTNAIEAGYVFVEARHVQKVNRNVSSFNTDPGTGRIRFSVGEGAGGTPIYAYLMMIPETEYLADQRALEQKNLQVDQAIRTGRVDGSETENAEDKEKRYIPSAGISYAPAGAGSATRPNN